MNVLPIVKGNIQLKFKPISAWVQFERISHFTAKKGFVGAERPATRVP
jgi:hypothetical protein